MKRFFSGLREFLAGRYHAFMRGRLMAELAQWDEDALDEILSSRLKEPGRIAKRPERDRPAATVRSRSRRGRRSLGEAGDAAWIALDPRAITGAA